MSDSKTLDSLSANFKAHLRQRKAYFNIGGPWKKWESSFAVEPGGLYYRVMTLDQKSLESITHKGFAIERANWDGQNVAGAPGISYGIGNADFMGDQKKALTVVFQLDGDRLPWDKLANPREDGSRPRYGARFLSDISADSINKIWAYDLKSEELHIIGERAHPTKS